MSYKKPDSNLLYDDATGVVVGVELPNGQWKHFSESGVAPDGVVTQAKLDAKQGAGAFIDLTDAATINTNAALGNNFRVTLGGDRTLANPTNMVDGQEYFHEIVQDATGSRKLALGSSFNLSANSMASINTSPNSVSMIRSKYSAASGKLTSSITGKTSSLVGYKDRIPNFIGGFKLRANSDFSSGQSGVQSGFFKFEAEAPFVGIRIHIGEKSTSGQSGLWKFQVGNTDTGLYDTVANAYLPRKGGVTYNSIVTGNSLDCGWRNGTFDNGATKKYASLTSGSNSCTEIVSDFIPLRSLARSDVAGGRPFALVKVVQELATGVFTTGGGNLGSYYSNTADPGFRHYLASKTSNDAIATIGNIPGSVSANNGYELYVWVEFIYDRPVRNFIYTGDSRKCSAFSILGGNGSATIGGWSSFAAYEASTQASPICAMNYAGSGHSQNEFTALVDNMLTSGVVPTDAQIPGFSQNGFSDPIVYINTFEKTLDKLRGVGAKIYSDTDYAVNGYTGSGETNRLMCVNHVRTLAANGLLTLVDTDALITDYSGSTGQILAADQVGGDGVHVGPAAQIRMKTLLKSLL